MARKAGQGKEEEESRARQQEEKTPVREEREDASLRWKRSPCSGTRIPIPIPNQICSFRKSFCKILNSSSFHPNICAVDIVLYAVNMLL
ncbi:hypothetical protein STEG23_017451 [Scotinomys teguina]